MISKALITGLLLVFCLFEVHGQRIAFGSCSRHNSEEQLWNEVLDKKPAFWIWVGDNVYADTHDMGKMAASYDLQKSRLGYQTLLKQTKIYGTWDDHDYGINDGGKNFSKKRESKEQLLRFLDVPSNADVRFREGVYQSYIIGEGNQKINLILLDTRSFRDTLMASSAKGRRYEINPDGDILGTEQWNWLEKELKRKDVAANMIVSSIQFIANDHGFEKWGNFPMARQKMLDLLVRTQPVFTFFLSGDRHIAEISKLDVPGLKFPLYDITSSGLTHTWSVIGTEKNSNRIGDLIVERNFGLIDFSWLDGKPVITMQIIGAGGSVLAAHKLR